ncbi:trypsin-like peptidase domain-containing protein [Edaphobacter albus]|uniref:trypsin-like peptidase domain-containing protein n=1 Tax=Edaphobacter sp. 4G125 TaxID=2763071 RepID=UPI001645DA14|nr:trypsin-like peptidase domain-containing protein [Edaphobacter sp. 4G125]QNI35284.1 trypsin-like peptidase domain-containing protein [Edaphobacter sp. 4G125]
MDISTSKFTSWFERAKNHRLTTTFALLATLSTGILVGSVITHGVSGKEQAPDSSDAKQLVIPSPTTLSNGFSQIVKQVGPAVVNINTESLPKQSQTKRNRRPGQPPQGYDGQGDMQDFFNRFFGNPGGGDDDSDGGPMGGERRALGSGFIVDPRGYIITNNHVVDKADKIYVRLSSDPDNPTDPGRAAKVIGTDKETDIAVIKIETDKPLPTIKLGNSDSAQVGDWVLAIGSPFGLSQTVSAGIVSAKNRSIDEPSPSGVSQSQFQRFIQTDAAINPGNSGGPLVDMAGQVIGMNTAIYTSSMGSMGVGFAMPANTIVNVYNMLIGPEHKVVRGSIGISFQSATSSAVGRVYGFKNGIIVSTVTPSGGAAKAGIKPGDVIVSIDGRQIKDGDDLVNDISARKVGSTVKLGYLRDGKQNTADVTIGDRAKTYADIAGDNDNDDNTPQESDAGQTKLGITVSAIPSPVAQKTGISRGVIVTAVRPGSFADENGLSKGAIITEINRKPVTDEASYRAIVNSLKSKDDVVFVIHSPNQKGGGNNYVGGTLP